VSEEKTGLSLTLGLHAKPDGPGGPLADIRPVNADPDVLAIGSAPAKQPIDSGAVDPDQEEDAAASRSYDPIALERALVAEANQALENKEYRRAAQCFARAVEFAPSRVDYLVMSGHCLKDAGDFGGAFVSYSAALAALPTGDTHVQFGHLFKITGNLYEAEAAYRQGARLGEASAQIELANLGSASEAQLTFFHASARHDNLPVELFWNVMLCGRGEMLDHGAIIRAGKSLALAGLLDLAKAFFETAYLSDETGAFREEHYSLVQWTSIWPTTHLSELIRARASRADRRAMPVRARIQRLIALTVAGESCDPDYAAPSPPFAREPSSGWPEVLDRDRCDALLMRLTGALDSAYRAFSVETPISAAAIIEGVRGLQQAVSASERVVTFPSGGSAADLRLVAAGILNNLIRRWLRDYVSRFLGAYARPEQIAAELLLGGNPLSELAAELGPAAAVFDEINRQLSPSPAGIAEVSNALLDQFFCWLAATGAPALSESQLDDFLQEAIRRRLDKSIAALVWNCVAARPLSGRIISWAQRLKTAGHSAIAYDLMNRSLDEKDAPREYLVEKALLAKINGDFGAAARLFERVAAAEPADAFSRQELAAILPEVEPLASILSRFQSDSLFLTTAKERRFFRKAMGEDGVNLDEAFCDEETRIFDLAPEMSSEFAPWSDPALREEIQVLDVGRQRRLGLSGELSVLHACDFVRARVQSLQDIISMRARIDGKTVGVALPWLIASGQSFGAVRAWMVNCWMDLSEVAVGAHELQLYFEERSGGYRSRELSVWVDPSPATPAADESGSVLNLPADAEGLSVDERVNRLPTVVLAAERNVFRGAFRKVLVIRADQLGDVVMSLPAMFALRALFPGAELTCLAAPSNRDLLLSTGLFAEILAVELVHDPATRRRFISIAEQLRLRTALSLKSFDLAVDLGAGEDTRSLLRLAGARYTAGFSPAHFPWLSLGVDLQTRDLGNGREASPHSVRPMALVEALAGVMRHSAFRLPNPNADNSLLAGLGLDPERAFATFHGGARTASRKWPVTNYLALAERLIKERGLQVALLVDSPTDLQGVEAEVVANPDLHVIAERLSFPQLDALLSFCTVFVGNDTGPKHLASVRGAPVVSIHMGAVNWREWGQESGFIVTRRTPCYACGIEHIEECGKGLPCLVNITVEDVFGAVEQALASNQVHVGCVHAPE
jgi:ADP-heptose:LPS heptosyltransferase/tetratricopeptide (TPR) repeat protein